MSWLDATHGDVSCAGLVFAGVNALAKLAQSKKHSALRQECGQVASHILEQTKRKEQAAASGTSVPIDGDANKYFYVLKLACDTGVSKIMSLALDITQKLIAFGYLDGTPILDTRIYVNPNIHLKKATNEISQIQQRITQIIADGIQAPNTSTNGHTNGNHATASSAATPTPSSSSSSASSSSSMPASSSFTHSTSTPSDITLASLTALSPATLLSGASSDGKLMSIMIDTFYQCSRYKDQQVQLLVLKCVLTCITSPSCSVHGWSLMQAIATCFQVYLSNPTATNGAGEEINRVTAKATLTQIANIVFQRMEHHAHQLKQMHFVQQQLRDQNTAAASSAAHQTSDSHSSNHLPNGSPDPVSTPPLPTPSPDSISTPSVMDGTSGSVLRPPLHPASASGPPSLNAPSPPGRRGYCVWCSRPADSYCLHTHDPVCSIECKLSNLRVKDPEGVITQKLMRKHIVQLELCQNDSYYLLRTLCRLASKVLPVASMNDKNETMSIAIDSKIVSLQLLLSILSNAGPTFRTTPHFISCIKSDLVNCILRNSAASSIETIFALSSSLFVATVCHFKPHLHSVIWTVLDTIYLPYIASPNSTFEHKYISLTVLHKIACDPQTLLELFINYDCDTASLGSTFQKIATTLEKVCRSRFMSENWLSAAEESRLRLLALEGLVDTIKSLLVWTKQAQANLLANKEATGDAGHQTLEYDSDDESTASDSTNGLATPSMRSSRALQRSSLTTGGIPSATPSASASPSLNESMAQFHALRAQKQRLDSGILKFNMRPKRGLQYLASHGLLQADSPQAVADFFIANSAAIDKVTLGDYMGEEGDFNKQVLYAYTEQLDFRQLPFDAAIRKFLDGFWLPVEAQKIDRMIEKFAEQYHRQNPGNFSSADTAYVLGYAVIMLNVDQHSPNMKQPRMTKEGWYKQCRGLDDGKDIDQTFLSNLYDAIAENEIQIPTSGNQTGKRGGGNTGVNKEILKRDRINMFLKESQEMVRKTTDYLESFQRKHDMERAQESGQSSSESGRRSSTEAAEASKMFQQATDSDIEAIRPMFDILWYPSLATFSVLLEENESRSDVVTDATANSSNSNYRTIELCLDGYRHAIRLSSALGIETSRLAFVTSLRKFTLLGSTREMKLKNIEAIKMLLLISHTEGNHLRESWLDVLQCISELERLHLFATRPIADVFQSSPMRTRESDSINSQHVNRIDASAIDRVFTSSAHLDSDAIVDFVKALRTVADQELANVHAPRVFCLQKLVEITYHNMGRIRVVWSKIWTVLSSFFTKAGGHPNLNVSMYAIDSLRQLAGKFLEKEELVAFQFQKQFFKPFELIMINNQSNETRELIVQCCARMVASRVNNIKSGWRGIFIIIRTAASQTYQPLVVAGFELISTILDQHFALLTSTTDTMDECVNCLVAFGCNNFTAISLRAIQYIQLCCDHLGEQQVTRREKLASRIAQQGDAAAASSSSLESGAANSLGTPQRHRSPSRTSVNDLSVSVPSSPVGGGGGGTISLEDDADGGLLSPTLSSSHSSDASSMQSDLKIWFLALTGLSRMVLDQRIEVRSRALLALFKILSAHGQHFSSSTWRAVFCGVLFPIFDDVRHTATNTNEKKRSASFLISSAANGGGVSEASTPSSRDDATPTATSSSSAAGVNGHSRSVASSSSHSGHWRNQSNWYWSPASSVPRPVRNAPAVPSSSMSTPAVTNQHHHGHSHSRELSSSNLNGLASAVVGAAAAVPAATTNTPATRIIPALPPPAPKQPSSGVPPRPPSNTSTPALSRQSTQSNVMRSNQASSSPETSWLGTTCFSALSTLVELFDHFYSSVSFMLPDLLALLHSCIVQDNEDLTRIGVRCLVMLLTKIGSKLSISAWWCALESLAEIVQRTMPQELMTAKLRVLLGLAESGDEQGDASAPPSRPSSQPGSRRGSTAAPNNSTTAPVVNTDSTDINNGTPAAVTNHSPALSPAASNSTPNLSINVTAPSQLSSAASPTLTAPIASATPTSASAATAIAGGSITHSPSPSPVAPTVRVTTPSAAVPPVPSSTLSPLPPPSAGVTPPLPFSSALVVGKFRAQLQLLDAIFQITDTFFPRKSIEDARLQQNDHQATMSTHDASDITLQHTSLDSEVLTRLTCPQAFFCLDLISSILSFARAFNLNLALRRKLYTFGFQTEQTLLGRLPQLFLQETRATRFYMQLLGRIIREGGHAQTNEQEEDTINGERWQQAHSQSSSGASSGVSLDDSQLYGPTPLLPSYSSYLGVSELRMIGLALRFLSDYVSKSVSNQLVSLEFSDELLCAFIEDLLLLAHESPRRFQRYMSIFYLPLIQLCAFGKEPIRHQLTRFLQAQATTQQLLAFTPITPFPQQKINANYTPTTNMKNGTTQEAL